MKSAECDNSAFRNRYSSQSPLHISRLAWHGKRVILRELRLHRIFPALLTTLGVSLAVAFPHEAAANLIQNADFTQYTYTGSLPLTTVYGMFGTESGNTLSLTDWTTSGYNFVYAPGTADAGTKTAVNSGAPNEAPGEYNYSSGYGDTYMFGSNNGGAGTVSGGIGTIDAGPAGGNMIAMDGAFQTSAVKQTITGLTIGQVYVLKFYWAAAQQQGFTGATTENLTVSLGSQSFTTSTVDLPYASFSGWMSQTFDYTATSTSETLSFLAAGTPSGEPPFVLVNGVDLELIPDFSNWLVFAGFGAGCILLETVRRRRQRIGTAA